MSLFLQDNPMEAMGDARELLRSIRAPHPVVYFNMVDDVSKNMTAFIQI